MAKPINQSVIAQLGNSNGTTRPSLLDTFKAKGSNLLGIFDDKARLGQAATAIAMLEGKSAADAAAYGQAISGSSPTTSKSVGTLYNVIWTAAGSDPGQLTGEQVYSTDADKINQIMADPQRALQKLTETPDNITSVDNDRIRTVGEDGLPVDKVISGSEAARKIQAENTAIANKLSSNLAANTKSQQDIAQIQALITDKELNLFQKIADAVARKLPFPNEKTQIDGLLSRLKTNTFISNLAEMRESSSSGASGLGALNKEELEQFSSNQFDYNADRLGYGKALFDELEKAKKLKAFERAQYIKLANILTETNNKLFNNPNDAEPLYTPSINRIDADLANLSGQ